MSNDTQTTIKIIELVGSPNCVDTADGQVVNKVVSERIEAGQPINLSFEGVERVTTAFLNAAIGQLYNEFSEEEVRRNLHFSVVTPISAKALTKVIKRAKEYFLNPDKFNKITKDVLDED